MSADPLVSVIVPCFNLARFLPHAIDSVRRQTWTAIEMIVVDDGSTDDTAQVAARLGVSVVRQRNRGLSHARNAGLRAARGDFIVFLDADDELLPDAVQSGVDVLMRQPAAAGVARRAVLIDADGRSLPTTHPMLTTTDIYRELLLTNFVWTPGAAVFRRDAVAAVGGFTPEAPAASDYALLLRLARTGRLVVDVRDAVRYRKHEANMSHDPILMLRAVLTALHRERTHVSGAHVDALCLGHRQWRAFYGEQLVEQLRGEWRGRRRLAVLLRGGWFLLRRCPERAAVHVRRKVVKALSWKRGIALR